MEKLNDEQARQEYLPLIDEFLADIFSSLSLSAFQSNALLAASISAPSWSFKKWSQSPTSPVFSSNLVLTRGGFRNAIHEDRDASKFSLGTWGLCDSESGKLITSDEIKKLLEDQKKGLLCDGLGAKFHVGNVVILLGEADVVAMNFNSHINHFTSHPTIPKNSSNSSVTRVSTSNQIAKTVVTALEKISNVQGGLSEEEWMFVQPGLGRDADDEVEKKKL